MREQREPFGGFVVIVHHNRTSWLDGFALALDRSMHTIRANRTCDCGRTRHKATRPHEVI
jgi:hypothetical protein